MAEDKKDKLADVEDMEISALDDKELESVSGGITDTNTVASCTCCASGATHIII
ncbi:MAG TPA: class IIb bacteriocin, lactobin A/cerein 7B family [Thermoanaerobaculia bacterium]|jgi:lactobin A/cerein 7B family class IIb bacteriocin|nr:class IIb bacteriocin, lactobin A/cerein 7B family [Thermoanaerobaculia bacterium]